MQIFLILYILINMIIFFFILNFEKSEKIWPVRFPTKWRWLISMLFPLSGLYFLSTSHYRKRCETLQQELREQVKYYERMCCADQSVRTFLHDYRNLRVGLQSFIKNKDPDGALQYLQKCEKDYIFNIISFETGNSVLDALLSEKQQAAEAAGTKIIFDGILPNQGIHPADLCIIFGNALDNAIKSCRLLENKALRIISITAYMNNNFLFITIENPNGQHMSGAQKNKKSQGLGLSSIQYAIKKYGGFCKIFADSQIFRMELCFDFHLVI